MLFRGLVERERRTLQGLDLAIKPAAAGRTDAVTCTAGGGGGRIFLGEGEFDSLGEMIIQEPGKGMDGERGRVV